MEKPAVPREPPVVVVTVEIDDECYRLARAPTADGRTWRLRKLEGQREGAVYEIREYADGYQRCTCMDAKFRGRACKHLLAMRQMGALPEPPPRPAPSRPAIGSRPEIHEER